MIAFNGYLVSLWDLAYFAACIVQFVIILWLIRQSDAA